MKLNEDYVVTANDIKYKDKDVLATLKITNGPFKDVEFHFDLCLVRNASDLLEKDSMSFFISSQILGSSNVAV